MQAAGGAQRDDLVAEGPRDAAEGERPGLVAARREADEDAAADDEHVAALEGGGKR